MTDKRNIGVRHISDATESRSRTLKLTEKKMKTKTRMIGLKQSQSPYNHTSYNCRKGKHFCKTSERVATLRKADACLSLQKYSCSVVVVLPCDWIIVICMYNVIYMALQCASRIALFYSGTCPKTHGTSCWCPREILFFPPHTKYSVVDIIVLILRFYNPKTSTKNQIQRLLQWRFA